LGKQLDKFVIAAYFFVDKYAEYNVGALEIPIFTILISSMDSVALPKIVEFYKNNEKKEILTLCHEMIRKFSILIIPTFIFLWVLAPQVISFLYTDRYSESAGIFRIYLLILPLRLIRFSVFLQAIGKSFIVLKGALLYLVVNFVLNILLIKIVGFTGPAWATFIGIFSLAAYYTWHVMKTMEINIFVIYPWKTLISILICASLGAIIVYPLTWLKLPLIIIILSSGLLYLVIYYILLIKTSVLTELDFNLIKRWMKFALIVR
jgi:O-antigen/teichoic acid export membrane protein